MKSVKIKSIKTSHYNGKVYNLELQTSNNDKTKDDLFWICNNIVVHNCFPKDINALIVVANENGVKPTVLSAAWQKNLELRPPEDRDWEKMGGRAVSTSSQKNESLVLYWSKITGHFVDKFTGKRTFEEISCTSDREWCETLIEVCIDAGNIRAKNLIKIGAMPDLTKAKLFDYPIRLLTNRKNSEYIKSSVLFTAKSKHDFPTQVTETIGNIGSIFTIVLDDCIADDVIYVGDYAEIYICDTSGQVKP